MGAASVLLLGCGVGGGLLAESSFASEIPMSSHRVW